MLNLRLISTDKIFLIGSYTYKSAITRSESPSRIRSAFLGVLLAAFACSDAAAFPINQPPPPTNVVEFHNTILDHYFLSSDFTEQAAIDAGSAGPGWVRTGYAFTTYSYASTLCGGCVSVSRFYGTPGLGPNSHFYTEDAAEAEFLRRPGSGWTFERLEFAVTLPAAGACAGGNPVYRLYNNRWMYNDSNHRYVTNTGERDAMVAKGWTDEGVHMCASSVYQTAIKTYKVDVPLGGNILPAAECENPVRVGGCISVGNLVAPRIKVVPSTFDDQQRFVSLTGIYSEEVFVSRSASFEEAARGEFINAAGPVYGLHINTDGRATSSLANISPHYQFATTAVSAATDQRFYPWRPAFSFETQLSFVAHFSLFKLALKDSGAHVFGHPSLQFLDTRSGRPFFFNILAYGNVANADFLAPDTATGYAIVGTTFRSGSPYGRNQFDETVATPTDLNLENGSGVFRYQEFRMDRSEFQHVLAAARNVDPSLSLDPGDYLLQSFRFVNNVAGNADLAMRVGDVSVRVFRR